MGYMYNSQRHVTWNYELCCLERWMLLLNAAEGKMVMRVLLYYSVLQFSSVWIFVVPSFAKFDDQVVGWRGNTCCVHSNLNCRFHKLIYTMNVPPKLGILGRDW